MLILADYFRHRRPVDPKMRPVGGRDRGAASIDCGFYKLWCTPRDTTRGIGLAAALHLAVSTPECDSFYEYSIEKNNLRAQMLKSEFRIADGYIEVPGGPGLGIEVDEEKMRSALTVTA